MAPVDDVITGDTSGFHNKLDPSELQEFEPMDKVY